MWLQDLGLEQPKIPLQIMSTFNKSLCVSKDISWLCEDRRDGGMQQTRNEPPCKIGAQKATSCDTGEDEIHYASNKNIVD